MAEFSHRFNHEFVMSEPPEEAQDRFISDVATKLCDEAGFSVVKNDPGKLVLVEGLNADTPPVDPSEPPPSEPHPPDAKTFAMAPRAGLLGVPWGSALADKYDFDALSALVDHHIHVSFTACPGGTEVSIHGSAKQNVRDSLEGIGEPGHWPNPAGAGDQTSLAG